MVIVLFDHLPVVCANFHWPKLASMEITTCVAGSWSQFQEASFSSLLILCIVTETESQLGCSYYGSEYTIQVNKQHVHAAH